MTSFILCFLLGVSASAEVNTEILVQRSDVIWGFDFFKDGKIVFTERGGKLAVFDPATKTVSEIAGVPEVFAEGQGGLLDVRVHPKSQDIFFTYSEPVGSGATTALGRAAVKGGRLAGFKRVFSADAESGNEIHFGSRIEFKEGFVFITVGDRNERKLAQDLAHHNGKILRLTEEGAPAPGNPFAGKAGARPEIWSLGHRSPQGLAIDPATGELWGAEMGPRGGDELNRIQAGANYGWPVITYGKEYWGPKIGQGTSKPGMEQPAAYWVPSISPSGLAVYRGDKFPQWNGHFFLACLSGTRLQRVKLVEGKASEQEVLLSGLSARFRNVRVGPEGYIYFSTDDGRIGRITGVK